MSTPKKRMINAYRGVSSDYIPVAPEFWFYYPAKVLGISMVEYQRELSHWVGMLAAFKKFGCEGWGIVSANTLNPHVEVTSKFRTIGEKKYRDQQTIKCKGKIFERSFIYHTEEPFWIEKNPVDNNSDVTTYFNSYINNDIEYDFTECNIAYETVNEDFLLEFDLGLPFFDFFEESMGFEKALLYFIDTDETILKDMFLRFIEHKTRLLQQAIKSTKFESFFIGCSSSCNSLLGPVLWRKWDKVYEKEITKECHKMGKLLHNHNHGKIMETVPDLVDIGFDCVCPFERPPGDISGVEGLKRVRDLLQDKVTFNGNIHTVATLLRGKPQDVRDQVIEIKEVFKGSSRVIIGTGDQVAAGTPEENIWAMIEETRRKIN